MDESDEVRCHDCGTLFGVRVVVGNAMWLRIQNAVVRSAVGVCAECGREWHWCASKRTFDRLMSHYDNGLPLDKIKSVV